MAVCHCRGVLSAVMAAAEGMARSTTTFSQLMYLYQLEASMDDAGLEGTTGFRGTAVLRAGLGLGLGLGLTISGS